jgi:hypothetical protein
MQSRKSFEFADVGHVGLMRRAYRNFDLKASRNHVTVETCMQVQVSYV